MAKRSALSSHERAPFGKAGVCASFVGQDFLSHPQLSKPGRNEHGDDDQQRGHYRHDSFSGKV
jgi:hypothetical protein